MNATGWDTGVIWSQTGNTVTVTNRGWSSSVSGNDGYKVSAKIYVKFTRNGTNATDATPANDTVVGGVPADGVYTILTNPSTGSFTFSVANPWTRTSTSNRLMIAKLTGGYTVASNPATSDPNDIIITCATTGRHDLLVGDHVWLDITGAPSATISPTDGEYIVDSIIDEDHFNVLASSNASATSQPNLTVYPLVKPPLVRTGAVTVQQSTYAMGSTTGSSTTADLNQSPLNSPTVFNYFYPDFKYGGNNSLAQAGLTVPEFQLTTDSNLVLLQNFLNGGFFSSGNGNGYTSFRSGSNVLVMDLNSYINAANTSDANVGTMVDSLNTLLCAGQLLPATKTAIVNHVAYSRTISSVSATSPAVVTTSAAHGLTTGEVVYVSGITGGTYSNGTLVGTNFTAVVTVLSPTTFSLIVSGQSSALNCSVAPTAGQLTAAKIVLFPYTTPTTTEMRDRARAVAHLIISSAEFAIQK